MVGILIVSHGKLADALISSVQSLVGNLDKIKGVPIWSKDREVEVKHRIQKEMAEVDDGDGVVILTDILGGTPTNLSLSFLEDERVEVVTGVNIPMLLTLASYRKGRSLGEIGSLVKKSGRRGIILAKEVLGLRRKPK
ncbi:MAG TPA: PTS fructose transporter subunit IIA [Thermodesulfobacteriota bacterium]|nr:PTS fructose transporter subunit IIA [Thermodesulfobacteriota bacterium]